MNVWTQHLFFNSIILNFKKVKDDNELRSSSFFLKKHTHKKQLVQPSSSPFLYKVKHKKRILMIWSLLFYLQNETQKDNNENNDYCLICNKTITQNDDNKLMKNFFANNRQEDDNEPSCCHLLHQKEKQPKDDDELGLIVIFFKHNNKKFLFDWRWQ